MINMAEIPQSIINQFFNDQGIKNTAVDSYGYAATISPNGDFLKYSGKELAVYRVTVLLSVTAGTYINDPDFGIDIGIFRKMNSTTINNLKNEISTKIAKYEKDLRLMGISESISEKNKSVKFTLNLKYTPTEESVVLSFGFLRDMQALTKVSLAD